MQDGNIENRKADHIAIARDGDVGFHQTGTLLDGVQLIHECLPDLDLDEIDTSTEILGKRLSVPLFVAGMTGGSPKSMEINRTLSSLADELGWGFGLGSQRAMLDDASRIETYRVRGDAPNVLLLGNIGVVQARGMSVEQVQEMLDAVGADALCVHMNPAMEAVQPEGDRDFRGGIETFARLVESLDRPVIAKETGCGISYTAAARLYSAGVRHVDVSGAGGTSWVAVEMLRARGDQRSLGELLREWGIPTAASVAMTSMAGMETIIATGGVSSGLDAARALALGASAAGLARPVLQALGHGGAEGARQMMARLERELRTVMLLVGARNLTELRSAPKILSPVLQTWVALAERQKAG